MKILKFTLIISVLLYFNNFIASDFSSRPHYLDNLQIRKQGLIKIDSSGEFYLQENNKEKTKYPLHSLTQGQEDFLKNNYFVSYELSKCQDHKDKVCFNVDGISGFSISDLKKLLGLATVLSCVYFYFKKLRK